MINFTYYVKKDQNYTPAEIITKWAKETNQKIIQTKYFNMFVDINGDLYEYDHLTQEPVGELVKLVIFLALKYRAE